MLSPQTAYWKRRGALLTCGARFLLLPLPRRRLPELWRGRTCSNVTAWHLQKGGSTFLVHSFPLLSDHVHFLLCVSCLGSSSDTQALATRRGWCFIFPPCSSAILFSVCFLFDKGTCYLTLKVNRHVVSNDLLGLSSCPSSLQPRGPVDYFH